MAYATGTANNFAELKTALTAQLLLNGWANPSGDTYTKDSVEVVLTSTESPDTTNGLGVRANAVFPTPTPPGPKRFWRVLGSQSNSNALACRELEFRGTIGGADLTGSGTAIASDSYSGFTPANAFDNNMSTVWGSNGKPAWIGYDFGVGNDVEINEFAWTVRADASYTQNPKAGSLEYSDDGSVWTAYFSWDNESWTSGQTRALNSSMVGRISAPYTSFLAAPSSHADVLTSWPVTYHCFIQSAPNEVFFVAEDVNLRIMYIAFGDSDVPGHTLPSGLWQAGTVSSSTRSDSGVSYIGIRAASAGQASGRATINAMPFWGAGYFYDGNTRNLDASYMFDGAKWLNTAVGGLTNPGSAPPDNGDIISTRYFDYQLYNRLPNAWNSETVLLPYQCWITYDVDDKASFLALEFRSLRKCRTNNFENADIVDFAGDKWMIFSAYKKDTIDPDGSPTMSGTHGFAVKYDGP